MSDNLKIYDAVREVPPTALKTINGGRMNGKSDINPMWRIKTLTEQFGACGIGWKYEVVRFWLEPGANNEVSAFAQINLYIKDGEKWSEPIPGIGGSAFVAKEKNGLYTSDECYKMALTDALSVACKALGVAANVYWDKDNTKYDRPPQAEPPASKETRATNLKVIEMLIKSLKLTSEYMSKNLEANYKVATINDLSDIQISKVLVWLNGKKNASKV
jgi:hypothetical protein